MNLVRVCLPQHYGSSDAQKVELIAGTFRQNFGTDTRHVPSNMLP